jgi:hypothetical protein
MKSLLLILLVTSINAFAQNVSIKGKVIDENGPVMYATVMLKNASDSSLYKGEITNENGEYNFQDIHPGNYFIQVQSVGYQTGFRHSVNATTGELRIEDIKLIQSAKQLNAVTISAEKPFIERQSDKMVVNVENSIIHAGSSVMEVFEKLPGVSVDQNGNIRLRGKQGVIIMIDGKPTAMSGQDLVNMLNGMSSANIQQIEIITNPSAKWDAAGNSGILNIIMKKNKLEGYNGNANINYGQGRYPKMTTSASLNYKKNKWSIFSNYSFSKRKGFNNLLIDRKFYSNGELNQQYLTNNYIRFPNQTHNPRLGVDYSLSNKTTVSLLYAGVYGQYSPTTVNHSDIYNHDQVITNTLDFSQDSKFKFYNNEINSQINHKFDTLGQNLTINLDYGKYSDNAHQNFSTLRTDVTNNLSDIVYLTGNETGDLSLYSFKADYSKPLKGDYSLETGIKSSLVKSDKDMRFYDGISSEQSFDTSRSSHFIYEENINAAYVSLQKKFKNLTVQAGLRGEQTVANGEQRLDGQTFDRNYFQVFPTLYLNYTVDKSTVNLNVGRRINRPGYGQMDPYKRLIDYMTYSEGNPYLLPELTYVTELSYSYNDSYFITANYSHTTQSINDILIQDAQTQKTVQSIVNLNTLDYWSIDLTYSKRLTGWWKTNTDLLGYYANYVGEVNDYSINRGGPTFSFSTINSFTITDKLSAELSYRFDYENWYGVTLVRNSSSLTAGLQYSVFEKRGTITTNMTDILWNAYPSGFTDFGDVTEDWTSIRDTRVFNVGFTYNFGKGKGNIRRSTGADDEKKRIQ